jgi:hypothetical protein
MRTIANYLATAALFLFGGYAYLKRMAVEDDGTTISQAITLSGVRRQMLHIADTEREYIIASDGCVSLDELIDLGKLEKGYDKRAGYTFSIECSDPDFTVIGTHAPMPPGSYLHFPTLVVDPDMKVRKVK